MTTFAYGVGTGTTQLTVTSGVQTRTRVFDAMGRLTQETNPEQNGTTYYLWDTTSISNPPPHTPSCSNSRPGTLAATIDANTNSICYTYDNQGRVTLIEPGNGASATNPCRWFVYDTTLSPIVYPIPTGVTVSNIAGHLVEATTNDCFHTVYTDEWFSYSARGEVTDVWESTPNSGEYYHTTASYFPDGGLQTLGGVPGQSTITYSVDGMGRGYSALQGSTTLVSSVVYDLSNHQVTATLGLGDKDIYNYDSNTGRMTQYQFSVGATPATLTGTLTWNANGTLQKHDIIDNLSNQTQNCDTISYDDLARLSAYNCGSVWSQTFSYDRYGNVTKSGSITWNPGYNAATNHYTLSGTSYDANGNLLNDTFATYTWNAYGKLATFIDSSHNYTFTYDAFDNLVERNNAGSINESLYTPIGFIGITQGQISASIRYPLPGGGTYKPGSDVLFHRDWLGSTHLISSRVNRTMYASAAYAPFGETYDLSGAYLNDFTGDPSDITGNGGGMSDTPNRELRVRQGRWISPDPARLAAVDVTNPQTWNRYAYVANNPMSSVDRSGLLGVHLFDCSLDSCSVESGGGGGGGGGGSGQVIMGNDIFDAIGGVPGTYLTMNMFGQLGFGVSIDIWKATYNAIDNVPSVVSGPILTAGTGPSAFIGTSNVNVAQSGWVVLLTDLGTGTTASGILPDAIALSQAATLLGQDFLQATQEATRAAIQAGVPAEDVHDIVNQQVFDVLGNQIQGVGNQLEKLYYELSPLLTFSAPTISGPMI